MRRDLQYKLLTLVFASIALVAMSACVVASSPSTSSEPDATEQTDVDTETTDEEISIESVEQVDSEPTQAPERNDDIEEESSPASESDDTADLDDSTSASTDTNRNEEDDDDAAEEVPVPGNPARLQIDSIDIDADFEYVGVDDDGNMDVPEEWENVAWFEPGTVPGDQGNSVVAGHYDSDTGPAVFYDLNDLEIGDEVRIVTEDGEELVFAVTEIESIHVDDADTSKIFGRTEERNLNLITCEGVWDTDAGMYDHRLIVYTTLIEDPE